MILDHPGGYNVIIRIFLLCLFFFKLISATCLLGFPCGLVVKNLPAVQETQVRSLGQENPLEKEMATHSSIPD